MLGSDGCGLRTGSSSGNGHELNPEIVIGDMFQSWNNNNEVGLN